MSELPVVACVLKTGGWKNRHMKVEYDARQVIWLRDQVAQHLRTGYRFVCFSDIDIDGVDVIPLTDNLPGWWSKIEMLKQDYGRIFYLDLDTVITGDITRMVKHPHRFSVLRNLSSKQTGRIGSGVMAWSGDHSIIYKTFMQNADVYMAEYVVSEKWGDQGFIQDVMKNNGGWDCLQDLFPGRIVSYKFDLYRRDPKPDNRIVCFHVEPKPWQTKHKWVPPLHG
jgi:hypothetical protein